VSKFKGTNEPLFLLRMMRFPSKLPKRLAMRRMFSKKKTHTLTICLQDEKCKVLVVSEELGIGINLPNIQNIIHFGLPVSKNEFVQEIG